LLYFGEERHAFKVEESSFSFVVAQAGGAGRVGGVKKTGGVAHCEYISPHSSARVCCLAPTPQKHAPKCSAYAPRPWYAASRPPRRPARPALPGSPPPPPPPGPPPRRPAVRRPWPRSPGPPGAWPLPPPPSRPRSPRHRRPLNGECQNGACNTEQERPADTRNACVFLRVGLGHSPSSAPSIGASIPNIA